MRGIHHHFHHVLFILNQSGRPALPQGDVTQKYKYQDAGFTSHLRDKNMEKQFGHKVKNLEGQKE